MTIKKHEPIAYYRADGFGEMVYRSNGTVDVRKNDCDFPKGLIKALYSEDYVKQLEDEVVRLSKKAVNIEESND